jgi:VWFA-related protein
LTALAFALVGLAFQQSPSPSPTPLSFGAGTSIVRIDVVATDKKKKVVSDLRPDEFEVLFGGRRITPSLAQFVPAVGSGWVTASPTDVTAPTGRVIAFVTAFPLIQTLGGSNFDSSMHMVMRVAAMLDSAVDLRKETDRIAIIPTDEPVPFMQFSRRSDELKSQVKRFEAAWRESRRSPIMVTSRDDMLSYQTRQVELAEHVIRALSAVSAKRLLFLVSESFPNGYPRPEAHPDILARVRALADLANRHRVTIFGINPRGAESHSDGLEFIAERTGGQTIQNTSRLKENLIDLFASNEGQYLVGFDPGTDAVKFPQKIQVRVVRKGVRTRLRPEVAAEDVAAPPSKNR